jgi:hypothetical protein
MVPLRSRRHGAQAHRDRLRLGAQKLVAVRVDAARAFFERVVRAEDDIDRVVYLLRGRGDE